MENKEGKTNKYETEDLTTSVGDNETILNVSSAFFSCSYVGKYGDSHSDVSRDDGSKSTNNESSGCVESAESWLNGEEK